MDTPDTTAPAPTTQSAPATTPTVTAAPAPVTPVTTAPSISPVTVATPSLHTPTPASGTAKQIAAHISLQQEIIDWAESVPATAEVAAARLKADLALAQTWYSGHRTLSLCIGSAIGGAILVLVLTSLP